MTIALVVGVVFFAAVVQSLTGFGFAIIIMPLLTLSLGLNTAAPLVALAGLTVYSINVVRYRKAVNVGELWRMALACALGVPLGIWVLVNVDESVVKQVLGWLLILYAVYALLRPVASRPISRRWVYPTGFVAGCLGAAYNTPGPPAIVYGSLRQWQKNEFRATLQAVFFVNAVLVVLSHAMTGHYTTSVLAYLLWVVPALGAGILVGTRLDRRVDGARFRTLVTVMILAIGVSLALGL